MARILILQDEPSWRASLRRRLAYSHELVIAQSQESATKALREDHFDLIIPFMHLQADDVFQFLREVKHYPILAQIPVVCFCGLRSRIANIARGAMETVSCSLGADAYLSIEDFCTGEECDLKRMRSAVEAHLEQSAKSKTGLKERRTSSLLL